MVSALKDGLDGSTFEKKDTTDIECYFRFFAKEEKVGMVIWS